MFHVKQPMRHVGGLIVGIVLMGGVACTGVSSPSGWAGPADAGNDIVLMHNERGSISAVRVNDTGSAVLWTFPPDADDHNYKAFYATPIIDRESSPPRALIASHSGRIVALDLESGAPVAGWPAEVKVDGEVIATPVLDDDTLYVATGAGEVVTVDISTGIVSDPLLETGDRIWSAPAFSNGTLFVASLDGELTAVAEDGTERWSEDVGAVAGDLTVEGDTVYAGTLDSHLVALDAASGDERWSFKGSNWFWARPLVTSDTIYAATTDGVVHAIDRATGNQKWERTAAATEIHASPVIMGGVLVVADRDGHIHGLDVATGAEVWEQQQADESFLADPLVLESSVFYLSKDGTLVRVRPQEQGALSVVYQRG
jgi:outer membrane protein assembly factor BamB